MKPEPEFEDWYRTAWPDLVGSLTLQAGDVESARDAAAEALVRVYERWDRVVTMASPMAYAYTVGHNLLRRRRRRQLLEQHLFRRERQVEVDPPSVDPSLWRALRALPERHRAAIALRYLLDLTQEQVARAMHVSPGTAASTLNAARGRLAHVLAPKLSEEQLHG